MSNTLATDTKHQVRSSFEPTHDPKVTVALLSATDLEKVVTPNAFNIAQSVTVENSIVPHHVAPIIQPDDTVVCCTVHVPDNVTVQPDSMSQSSIT